MPCSRVLYTGSCSILMSKLSKHFPSDVGSLKSSKSVVRLATWFGSMHDEVAEEFSCATYCCRCRILKCLLCIEVVVGMLDVSVDDSMFSTFILR